jgi:hypothetical protein
MQSGGKPINVGALGVPSIGTGERHFVFSGEGGSAAMLGFFRKVTPMFSTLES